jgi:hypothetical protein
MAMVVANNYLSVKNGILIINLFLLLLSYAVRGEEVLSRRLSVSFQEIPLKQALDEVAKLAGFEWSYNASILDADRRVSLSARDWTVRETLRELLGDGYAYKSSGRYLILKKQKPPKSELSGVVRDPKTGERLANVTVYDRKTLRATTTDSSGYYRLKVKKKAEVVVARLGYRDTVLQVNSLTPRYQKIELSPIAIPPADSTTLPDKLLQSLQKTATELEYFFAATLDKWHELNVPDTLQRRVQLSLLPYVGTNHVLSGKVENQWSVNILAGRSAGVRGVELAGLANFTKKQVKGAQFAGLFNVNSGNCTGVQAAGLFNQTADTLYGVQAAGLVNVASLSPRLFVQASGLVNILRKNNKTDSAVTTPKGVQVAGLVNKTDQLTGVQASGLVNSANDIKGVQVAGLVNRARRVRGLQIGLFNHTNELHGLQIGLINRSGKRWLPFVNWGR